MLRVDNGSFLENSSNINYAKRPANKCVTRREEVRKIERAACDKNADAVKLLDQFHRDNACQVHTCVPQKKCMAKVGLHDSNGNFLTKELVGANLNANLRVGGNQIGYVYQEKSINNVSALADALRANNPVAASVAQKIAQSNAELFGKPHAWDGSDHGYFCVDDCPKQPKPCPRNVCKKADPLFNPELGIGSDGLEAKQSLREANEAQVFRQRQAAMATTASQAVAQTAEMGTETRGRGESDAVAIARGGRVIYAQRRSATVSSSPTSGASPVSTPGSMEPTSTRLMGRERDQL
jgi:hypothetical protein